jgi:hypothetical protein
VQYQVSMHLSASPSHCWDFRTADD